MFVQRVKCGEELVALLTNMEREKYNRGKAKNCFIIMKFRIRQVIKYIRKIDKNRGEERLIVTA